MCWRTPRKHENVGPVLLGPVSHRARLRVERSAEGRDHQRTLCCFRSRRHVRCRTPRGTNMQRTEGTKAWVATLRQYERLWSCRAHRSGLPSQQWRSLPAGTAGVRMPCILPASSRKLSPVCSQQPLRTWGPSEQSGQDARGPQSRGSLSSDTSTGPLRTSRVRAVGADTGTPAIVSSVQKRGSGLNWAEVDTGPSGGETATFGTEPTVARPTSRRGDCGARPPSTLSTLASTVWRSRRPWCPR